MPEAPEARYLADDINTRFSGKQLTRIEIMYGRYLKHGPPQGYQEFTGNMPCNLVRAYNKGKVVLMDFSNGFTLISRLGLAGWWYSSQHPPTWQKIRENVVMHFSDESQLVYSDLLSYGTMNWIKSQHVQDELSKLAPDVMVTSFDEIKERLYSRKAARKGDMLIEDAIVDQELVVSGIGNYLKSEIVLYLSGISPLRTLFQVSEAEWARIIQVAQVIAGEMLHALKAGEDTAYEDTMRVYRKKNDPLGHPVSCRKTKGGRTTFWVPAEQI